jgi:thiamine-monophosphate kinase
LSENSDLFNGVASSFQSPSLQDLGEKGLLKLLKPFCSDLMGDDGAVMGGLASDYEMVVTTDILIDGVHFSFQTTKPQDAGWRAAAANLSDLAAMGAMPWGVTLALGLPPNTNVDWILEVYQGFTDCLNQFGAELVGGDTVRSPIKTLSVTAFGKVKSEQIIYRHTAQVGDLIVITGAHGLSKAGLEILLNPDLAKNLSQAAIAKLHKAHQRPTPRLDVIPKLSNLVSGRVSGMDSSDGLADAIAQICAASNVGAKLDWEKILIAEEIKLLAGGLEIQAIDWVMYGGEDFELVLCLAPEYAHSLIKEFPESAIIGEIIPRNHESSLDIAKSFQHFGSYSFPS